MWITFKSSVNTNTNERIMLGVIYESPIDSSYNDIKIFLTFLNYNIVNVQTIMIFFFVGISMPAQVPYRIL